MWHYYAGAPLVLETAAGQGGPVRRMKLGPDIAMGDGAGRGAGGTLQAAETLGDWTLVGCTVAPDLNSRIRDGGEGLEPGA